MQEQARYFRKLQQELGRVELLGSPSRQWKAKNNTQAPQAGMSQKEWLG